MDLTLWLVTMLFGLWHNLKRDGTWKRYYLRDSWQQWTGHYSVHSSTLYVILETDMWKVFLKSQFKTKTSNFFSISSLVPQKHAIKLLQCCALCREQVPKYRPLQKSLKYDCRHEIAFILFLRCRFNKQVTLGFDKVCKEIDYFVTRLTGLKFKALNEVSPLLHIQLKNWRLRSSYNG